VTAHTAHPPGAPPAEKVGAIGLALAMHLLLAALLLVGLRWQSHAPVAVQAELWVPPPAPAPVITAPLPSAPRPIDKPLPAPVRAEPVPPKADIAIETQRREREQKAAREQAAREQAERERQAREEQARRRAEAQEQARRKAQAQEQARQEAAARREAEAKKAQAAAEARAREEAQARERSRDEYLKRTLEQASRPGPAVGAAVGAEAGGAQGAALGSWGAKVSSQIRASTVFAIPPDLRGNPKAEFALTVMPDGSIGSLRLTRSSGVPAWDQAAERAIRRADPLPRPPPGTPREIAIAHGPRDE
jgi:colicin import membrane protein